jgi:flagellar motor switch protein FliM
VKWLAFETEGIPYGKKCVRRHRFERRSSLPVSAACVASSGVRETLASLLRANVTVRLLEPAVPSPEAWAAIARGATLYRMRGSVADAAVVLRPADAAAIAAAAFGEAASSAMPDRDLSPLERDVLDRTVAAIASTLNAVCGTRERETLERIQTICGFVTYFEILLETPIEARIGIALSRDPVPEPHGKLSLDDLADVALAPVVSVDIARATASVLANLAPGALVPMARSSAIRGELRLGGRTLARGTCGIRDGRYALAIGEPS